VKQMLRAPKTPHDILYRMLGTRQNSPRPLRGAACGTKHGKAQKQLRGQGGNVAGLVLWAPVAARRDDVRAAQHVEQMLRAPKTYQDILYSTAKTPRGRSAAPKMYHDILYSTAKTPRGRSAALSGELGGVAGRSAFSGLAYPQKYRF
jgi:hypothetical protein